MIDLHKYQKFVKEIAFYPKEYRLLYPALGMNTEAGEAGEILKKAARDGRVKLTAQEKAHLTEELGDVLWYIAAICNENDIKMRDVVWENITKLEERYNKK